MMYKGYPDPLAKWNEKKTDAYGLSFAKAIGVDWFDGGLINSTCAFSVKRSKMRTNRLYVRGGNSVEEAKNLTNKEEGDASMLNLDFRIVNNVGKFCNIVSNGINDDGYSLVISAKDKLSLEMKRDDKNSKLQSMRAMPLLKMAKESIGVDMLPKGFVPRDIEEMNIYEQMKEKSKVEIAEKIIINHVKDVNNWKMIEKEKNKDLTNCGLAGVRIYTCPRDGIRIQFLDVEYLLYGRVKMNDFSDSKYYGYVDRVSLGDIARETDIADKALRLIAKSYSSKNNDSLNYNTCAIDELYGCQVDVLRFAFETTKEAVYKKKKRGDKTIKVTKKKDDYDPPTNKRYEKLSSVKGTWMEGSYVIGSDIVYNYKESENIVRDELDKPIAPFVLRATNIYENELHAFLDDIIPMADELQRIHLKIQHLRSEYKPPIIEIDLDVLASVDEETNKMTFHKEVLNMMNVKGVLIRKRVNMGEDGIKEGNPVSTRGSNESNTMAHLLNLYVHYYNQIRDVTGVTPAADGSLKSDALLGVSQMAKLATNTATAHIVDAAIDFNKRVAEVISNRVHAIYRNKNAKHLQEMYAKAVGKRNIEAVEALKDRQLHDFGFTVEMIPTGQALQDFKEDLGLYLQQGLISPEIKSEATRIAKSSLKLASQYLAYQSKKRQEELAKQQQQTMQFKTESDVAAAKQASEGRIQEEALKTKMQLQYETAMSSIRVAEKEAMLSLESPEKEKEFQQDVYLEQVRSRARIGEAEFKETAKDNRLKKQSSHQSKLIDQRGNDKAPIDFENDFSNFIN